MFETMTGFPQDKGGVSVLPTDECLRLLDSSNFGRVAFVSAGEPVIVPVNYGFDRDMIVFRTGLGKKLDVAQMRVRVAFEIDGWDDKQRTGWSVLVQGIAEEVDDTVEIEQLSELGVRPAASEGRDYWVRIRPFDITGRRIP